MKRINRVRKHSDFASIEHAAAPIKSKHFVVYSKQNELGYSRIGITASKRNGNAVTRNRIKRQIRSMIARGYDLTISQDVIIIAKISYDCGCFHEQKEELLSLLREIGEPRIGKE